MSDRSPRFRSVLDQFAPYKPGRRVANAAGQSFKLASNECPFGPLPSVAKAITVRAVMLCTSTSGDSAATVIVSSMAPTFISALIVAVKSEVSSTPSRLTVLNPGRLNVTE